MQFIMLRSTVLLTELVAVELIKPARDKLVLIPLSRNIRLCCSHAHIDRVCIIDYEDDDQN